MKYPRRIALALVCIALAPVGAVLGVLFCFALAVFGLLGLDIPEYPKESRP